MTCQQYLPYPPGYPKNLLESAGKIEKPERDWQLEAGANILSVPFKSVLEKRLWNPWIL